MALPFGRAAAGKAVVRPRESSAGGFQLPPGIALQHPASLLLAPSASTSEGNHGARCGGEALAGG